MAVNQSEADQEVRSQATSRQWRQAHLLSVLSRRRRSQLLPHRGAGNRTPDGRTVAERQKGLARRVQSRP
jgi:hypothetical protein